MTKKNVEIIGEDQVSTEVLAEALVNISDSVTKLLNGPLNRRAIVILLQDSLGGRNAVSKETIEAVLDAAATLKAKYVVKGKRVVDL